MNRPLLFSNFVLALLLLSSWNLSAQDYHFTQGFSSNGTPDGWDTFEVSYSNSTKNAANMVDTLAAYCAKMKTDEAPSWLRTPKVIGAGTLTFWCRVKAPDITPSLAIQTSTDGENWTDKVVNPEGLDLTNGDDFQNITVPIDIEESIFIRFYVSSAEPGSSSNGTITIDDIQVTKPAAATNDVLLSTLTLGGEPLAGFDPTITSYNDTINMGWDYTIAATPNNPKATVEVTQLSNIAGTEAERTASVKVTGEDGTTVATTTIVIFQNSYFVKEGFGDESTGNLSIKNWLGVGTYQSQNNVPAGAKNLYPGLASMKFTRGHATGNNTTPGIMESPMYKNVGRLTFWIAEEAEYDEHALNIYVKKRGDSTLVKSISSSQMNLTWQEISVDIFEEDSIQIRIEASCDINDEGDSRIWIDDFLLTSWDPVSAPNTNIDATVRIYPNPVREQLNFTMANNAYEQVEIYRISGQKVLLQPIIPGQSNINIEHLSSGIYIASFKGIAGNYTTKFVKN